MTSPSQIPPVSQAAFWTGHVMGVLPCLMMVFSAVMKFAPPAGVPEHFEELGWTMKAMFYVGLLEFACTILYLIPRTAVLGAILLTGYLGGAIAAHVRIADYSVIFQLVLGILLWGGLWLRDPRVRALIPLR